MLTDSEIIQHLRLDPDEYAYQSAHYKGLALAAVQAVELKTGRVLVDVGEVPAGVQPDTLLPPGSPENAAAVGGALRLALKLLVAHFDANRGDTDAPWPAAVGCLVSPYQWITL